MQQHCHNRVVERMVVVTSIITSWRGRWWIAGICSGRSTIWFISPLWLIPVRYSTWSSPPWTSLPSQISAVSLISRGRSIPPPPTPTIRWSTIPARRGRPWSDASCLLHTQHPSMKIYRIQFLDGSIRIIRIGQCDKSKSPGFLQVRIPDDSISQDLQWKKKESKKIPCHILRIIPTMPDHPRPLPNH